MFASKTKTPSNPTEEPRPASIKAFLGAGSDFEGRMTFCENMRIDGTFRGEIASQDLLVIGETGSLNAEVSVGSMVVSGSFQGTIKAQSSVQIKAPAKVTGEIICPRVSIEDGVVFDGSIHMSTQSRSSESPPGGQATNEQRRAFPSLAQSPNHQLSKTAIS